VAQAGIAERRVMQAAGMGGIGVEICGGVRQVALQFQRGKRAGLACQHGSQQNKTLGLDFGDRGCARQMALALMVHIISDAAVQSRAFRPLR
jgi:hypothetical protein